MEYGGRYSNVDASPAASQRYTYDQAYAASGGGCGCGCNGGGGGLLSAIDSTDILTIGALGILAGISIFLAFQVTQGKRRKRGKRRAEMAWCSGMNPPSVKV